MDFVGSAIDRSTVRAGIASLVAGIVVIAGCSSGAGEAGTSSESSGSSSGGGTSHDGGGSGGGRDGSATPEAGAASCSKDGSDAVAWGTYEDVYDSPGQEVILAPGPGCAFCWDVNTGNSPEMSGGATWSSAWSPDHSQIGISIYQDGNPENLSVQFTVTPDGRDLTVTTSVGYLVIGAAQVPDAASCDGRGVFH